MNTSEHFANRDTLPSSGPSRRATIARSILLLGVVFACTNTAGQSTMKFEYDADGNLTRTIDARGNTTKQEYDSFHRLTRQTLPVPMVGAANPTISFTHDYRDQVTSVTDPKNNATRFVMDGLGNKNSGTSPDTGTTVRTFDADGNLKTSKDARGITTSYTYDELNRVTRIDYAGWPSTTFEYDTGSAGAIGRLSRMTDESGETRYSYDPIGRLLAKAQLVNSPSQSPIQLNVGYEYGSTGYAHGKVTSITYPSGNRIAVDYDHSGRARSLTLMPANGGAPIPLLSHISYLPLGQVKSWVWGNDTGTNPNAYAREFDLTGRVIRYPLGLVSAGGANRTLTYDPVGRIARAEHKKGIEPDSPAVPELDQTYGYDELGRLTMFSANGAVQRYSYDANGNRTTLAFGGTIYANAIHDFSNKLLSTTGPLPQKTNTFDAAGNLISDGTMTFTYSPRGRLQIAHTGGLSFDYLYNGLGQRVRKSDSSAPIAARGQYFAYDEQQHLLGQYDAAGAALEETAYLGDTPVAVLKNAGAASNGIAQVYFVYADHLETPRVIARFSDNKIVWRWDSSDPFGLSPPIDTSEGGVPFNYNRRFPGQYYDSETNLHYNHYRDYDPQTGRYVQSDPIGLNGGINSYLYVGADPVSHSDSTGEAPDQWWRPCNKDQINMCVQECASQNKEFESCAVRWIKGQGIKNPWAGTPSSGGVSCSCKRKEENFCSTNRCKKIIGGLVIGGLIIGGACVAGAVGAAGGAAVGLGLQ